MNLHLTHTPSSFDLSHVKRENEATNDLPNETGPILDARFLSQLRDRNSEAFDILVRNEDPRIAKLVSRLSGWNGDCDDIVQEVFIDAWQSIGKFRGNSSVTTWLYSIAVNRCRNNRRARRMWNKCFDKVCELWVSKNHRRESYKFGPGIEDIQKAMNQLNQGDREIVVLVCLEKISLTQASELLNVRQNTLEVRLHRARQRLKNILSVETDD